MNRNSYIYFKLVERKKLMIKKKEKKSKIIIKIKNWDNNKLKYIIIGIN